MSERGVATTSGGEYPGVPSEVSVWSVDETRPRSASFGTPWTNTMFEGLTSRWMSPASWSSASERVRSMPMRRTSSSAMSGRFLRCALRVAGT